MDASLRYDRVSKATEAQRGSWMPAGRRDRIKRKLVAGCLAAMAALCCCCCCGSRTNSASGSEVEEEKAMAMQRFANQDGL